MGSAKTRMLTVLSDNFSSTIIPPLLGEWGFSAYLETEDVKILYDVGNSGIPVLHNAEKLGIRLEQVDYVVLSHGHLDHTGGLGNSKLLRKLEGKVLVAHPSIFEKKFLNWSGKLQYIGLPLTVDEMERKFHLILTKKPVELSKGVYFSGEVKRYGYDEYVSGLFKVSNDGVVEDHMSDDAALYVKTGEGTVILTGCGHSGILNIMNHAKEVMNDKIYAAIGGFHLLSSSRDHVEKVTTELMNNVTKIGPAHCSGNVIKSIVGSDSKRWIDAGVGKGL